MNGVLRIVPALWLAALAASMLAAAPARGQILDRVEVSRDGANARIEIRFGVQMQYLRHAPPDHGQLVTIFFRFTGGEEAATSTFQESRRAQPSDLVPPFDVEYPAQPGPFGTQRRLEIRFKAPVDYRVQPIDNRTIAVFVPLPPALREKPTAATTPPGGAPAAPVAVPAAPGAAPSAPVPAAPAPVAPVPPVREGVAVPPFGTPAPALAAPAGGSDADAEGQMRSARDALEAGQWDAAALALNRVLNLPPNRFSQEAQELIGLAREKLGETAKARVEYELYLRLYPDGPGAERVKSRLAALPPGETPPREAGAGEPGARAAVPRRFTGWGSVSQYYYAGKSKVENATTIVTPATDATTIDRQQFSAVDQSQIVNNVDVTGRWQEGAFDSRLVFRDAFTWNLLHGGDNDNRLSAAYAETRYQPNDTMARIGRQLGTSGGVLGRYDGASASFALARDWRAGLVAGSAVDVPSGTRPIFAGAAVDAANLFPQKLPGLGGQVFAIVQKVAGATDRVGLGGEARYFDPDRSAYGLFDYDPLYHAVNIASLQGTWRLASGTAFNLLADYRRTPTLSLTNVVVGEGTIDIRGLIAARGLDTIRDEAKALTPISKVYLLGVTQPVGAKWQLGLDFRLSSLSGIGATSTLPAAPGTGNVLTYTVQAIGTSLTVWQDILVLDASVLHSPTLDGWTVGANYLFTPWQKITLQPTFRYYHQTDNQGGRLTRIEPGVRVVYRLRDRFSIEGEANFERTRSSSQLVEDLLSRPFFYVGWHWDF